MSTLPANAERILNEHGFGPRMRRALELALTGDSYREAAERAGLRSHQDIAREIERLGLGDEHLRSWRDGWRKAAGKLPPLWRHHLRHLF